MNFLAHFLLAHPDSELMAGGFLGDFVKGPLGKKEYSSNIEVGIRLHRAIDVFTDQHPIVKRSHQRFEGDYRRYAPIICDIAYDYLLAKNWQDYHEQDLANFCGQAYRAVLQQEKQLPERAHLSIKNMSVHHVMESYTEADFIERVLIRLSKRLTRKNPIGDSFKIIAVQEAELKIDFKAFMPEVIAFSQQWLHTEVGYANYR